MVVGLGLFAAICCGDSGTDTPTPTRAIALSGNLAFGVVRIGAPATATLSIKNSGGETLTVSGISYPDGFSGDWASGQIGAGKFQAVTVTFAPTEPKSYGGTITVSSSATSGTNTIDVSGTGEKVWTLTGLVKDWHIAPSDLAILGQEIYVSGHFDRRVAVLSLNGEILRYHTIEIASEYSTSCVGVTSQGRVLAVSSKGIWELRPDGTTVKLLSLNLIMDHATVGLDDNLYVSIRSEERTRIVKLSLDGQTADLVTVDSYRISDLAFDAAGNLFLADGANGRILKYSPGSGVQVFSSGFPAPATHGGGGIYLDFDPAGRIYVSSAWIHLALVSAGGTLVPASEAVNISGDLVFHQGTLYALDIFTAQMHAIALNDTTVLSNRVILGGVVPWYIDNLGETIVGQRDSPPNRKFFNYDIAQPGRIDPNPFLTGLQPDQYAFGDSGEMYLLFGRILRKLDAAGRELYRVSLPGNIQWNTRLTHNPVDGKIYYFDAGSNSVIRADGQGAETYHRFSATAINAYLTVTKQGTVYAGIISTAGAKLVDITRPPEERLIWMPATTTIPVYIHIGCDAKGILYAALGPVFQSVFCIEPATGTAVSLFDNSDARYDWGFVDPQGFLVMDSGKVVLSAPGVLVAFVPAF